jgi:hypothetical protein
MVKTLSWLWKLPWSWIVAGISLLSAYLIYRSKKNTVSTFEDAQEVQRLREAVRRDELEVDKLLENADAHATELAAVKREIEAGRKAILQLSTPLEPGTVRKMTDEEVSAEFTRLGF